MFYKDKITSSVKAMNKEHNNMHSVAKQHPYANSEEASSESKDVSGASACFDGNQNYAYREFVNVENSSASNSYSFNKDFLHLLGRVWQKMLCPATLFI